MTMDAEARWERNELAELLAAIAEGDTAVADIDDETLERCVAVFGRDALAEAVIAGERVDAARHPAHAGGKQPARTAAPVVSIETARPPRRELAARRVPAWTLLAASVLVAIGLLYWVRRGSPIVSPQMPGLPTSTFALVWTPAAVEPGRATPWGRPMVSPSTRRPDFNLVQGTPGAAVDPFMAARLATVVLHAGKAWRTGVLLDDRGWILTTFRSVEQAAYDRALAGQPATIDVVTATLVDGAIRPAPAWPATLYRADPERDLALLRLDEPLPARLPAGVTFAPDDAPRPGERCFIVGSAGGRAAWWASGGAIVKTLDYPDRSDAATPARARPLAAIAGACTCW